MGGVDRILGHVVDCHDLAMLPNFVAKSSLDLELAAWRQTEVNVVEHLASNPPAFRHPRHRRKPHSGRPADDVQDCRYRRDLLHCVDVGLKLVRHGIPLTSVNDL